jgi:hypothetical protein
MDASPRRSTKSAMLKRLGLFVVALFSAALVAELVLPLFPPRLGTMRRIVHHVGNSGNYGLVPGVKVRFSGMFHTISPSVLWQVNDQGLRDDTDVGPRGSRYRIATYGDSETFGWSVALEDTFQRRMETIDPGVEVVNLGVPGYNAVDIARRIEATLATYDPDLVVYLVNANDDDPPIHISDAVLSSELLLRLRFFYQTVLTWDGRARARQHPDRLAFLAGQIDRIHAFTQAHGVPLLLVYMRERTWKGTRKYAPRGGFLASTAGIDGPVPGVIEVEKELRSFPELDSHMNAGSHAALAARLCSVISKGTEARCTPPDWSQRPRPGGSPRREYEAVLQPVRSDRRLDARPSDASAASAP